MIYIVILCIFFFLLILFNAILFSMFYKMKPIEKLKYYDESYQVQAKVDNHKKSRPGLLKLLSKLIPNVYIGKRFNKKLQDNLVKADIPITIEELLVIKLLFSFTLSFLLYSFLKDILISLLALIIIWNIPNIMISRRKHGRIKQFNEQINDGIMIISNSMKAGYSFLQAIAVVVEETRDPFAKEFKKLLKEISLGISTEDALKSMLYRMDSDDLRLVVNAILIQKDIGGNLSEILDNISQTIRDRQKIQNELKTLTAQGKLSGMIILFIPVFLGLIIYLFNKEYILVLFNTQLGIAMVINAIISQLLGLFAIRKIIKIEI